MIWSDDQQYLSRCSHREFLTTSGASGAMLLGPGWLNAAGDAFDTRVPQVMSGIIGIDIHSHVYPEAGGTASAWSAATALGRA